LWLLEHATGILVDRWAIGRKTPGAAGRTLRQSAATTVILRENRHRAMTS